MSDYEAVIGLEVHAQLRTRTKIFCGCPTTYGAPPNSLTCPVCLGHPGALPVLNRRAVELAVRAALALECEVRERSVFSRKNYFYPDLPKGYQISQYDEPLAVGGRVRFEVDGRPREVGLIRLHLEEDAGKLVHEGMADSGERSYVDLNRAGVPLVEIVSRPELRTAEEAYLFLQRLRSVLLYTDVCDGNMEQGSLRCDANISIRRRGDRELGTRTELKNLNSFRNVQRALEYEIGRQVRTLAAGSEVVQQTVLWDAADGSTRPMRGKEEAQDYRYFPEPDLLPLALEREWIATARRALPELPAGRKARLIAEYALSDYEAGRLTLEPGLAAYYEAVAGYSGNAKAAANFVLNDLLRAHKGATRVEDDIPLPAARLAELIRMVDEQTISVSAARGLFEELYRTGRPPADLVREQGLAQVSDEATLRELVQRVIDDNPEHVARYRAGKQGLFGYLVGQVMRASKGKANPGMVNRLLREQIGRMPE